VDFVVATERTASNGLLWEVSRDLGRLVISGLSETGVGGGCFHWVGGVDGAGTICRCIFTVPGFLLLVSAAGKEFIKKKKKRW
jgi:hypothetical protein